MIYAIFFICLAAGALTWFAITDFSGNKRDKKKSSSS